MVAAVTIGSDPEFFIRDTRTGGVVPIIGLLGGTKEEPLPIPHMDEGYAMQEDNVMAEYNIPPMTTARGFARAVCSAREAVVNFVRTKQDYLSADFGCSRLFPHFMLEHKQAQVFGCSPDFDAHRQGEPLRPPEKAMMEEVDGEWRFAGGHVHIGYESAAPDFVAAALCDIYLGLPSVHSDKQGIRRQAYGSAGRYRPTKYGIEYRTLSNFWTFDREASMNVGSRAMTVGHLMSGDEDRLHTLFSEIPWIDVVSAINDEDEQQAADLIVYCRNHLNMEGL